VDSQLASICDNFDWKSLSSSDFQIPKYMENLAKHTQEMRRLVQETDRYIARLGKDEFGIVCLLPILSAIIAISCDYGVHPCIRVTLNPIWEALFITQCGLMQICARGEKLQSCRL
jgi:hypothetical protein